MTPAVVPPDFLAIDGEGGNAPDGRHLYVELGAGDGSRLRNPEGLSTWEIFDWLLSLPGAVTVKEARWRSGEKIKWKVTQARSVRPVIFGGSYDFAHWVRDLPQPRRNELWKYGRTAFWRRWQRWSIEWSDRRHFVLTMTSRGVRRSVTVDDCFALFSQSFLQVIRKWTDATEEEIGLIEEMKERRSQFSVEDRSRIAEYNDLELRLLGETIARFARVLAGEGIKLNRWTSAGQVAKAYMRRHKVKDCMSSGDDLAPDEVGLMSYYGGRAQVLKLGLIEEEIHEHDIRSAYPNEQRRVPCLRHGRWERVAEWEEGVELGAWLVSWDIGPLRDNPLHPLTPFPWRDQNGSISWPTMGAGWYQHPEVAAARELWGDAVRVHSGVVWRAECGERPFVYLDDLYEQRRAYREAGHPAEYPVKIGLNSTYGATAECSHDEEHVPRYQCYPWAAHITAGCRAQILRACAADPDAVISIATDGILALRPLAVEAGDGLGDWETGSFGGLFVCQPGFRWSLDGSDGTMKTRGLHKREVVRTSFVKAWEADEWRGAVTETVTRFSGFHLAMARGKPEQIGQWLSSAKTIKLRPASGNPGRRRWDIRGRVVEWNPDLGRLDRLSYPYRPERGLERLQGAWGQAQLEYESQL